MAEDFKWYVVHTYSGYENAVAAAVLKAAENLDKTHLIGEVKIPLETVTENTENGEKTYERKTYPGYVFIRMKLTDESWHLVHNVRGATGFVGSDGKAVPLTESEIAELGIIRHEHAAEFKPGDKVKVLAGPLEGSKGVIEEVDASKERIRVIVSAFNRETPVDLEYNQIELVSD